MRRDSFEHFYLSKVALGEGCGCAEHVTRIREIDRYAAARGGSVSAQPLPFPWLRRIFGCFKPGHVG